MVPLHSVNALRQNGIVERAMAHGFRTSFRTWVAENGVRDEVSEAALVPADQNSGRAAYLRTANLEERRCLMQTWAELAAGH